MRSSSLFLVGVLLVACATENGGDQQGSSGASDGGAGGTLDDGSGNADGDCLTDGEELALGTDPNAVDSDMDGVSDSAEIDCVSDPLDTAEVCYACGWKHNDPGNLVSTGATEGSTIANVSLIDQCNEPVNLWDFAGEYHILYLTAAW